MSLYFVSSCRLDKIRQTCIITYIYYTALLNAVERSVHLHGPSRLPVVNCFSIMTVAMHIMTTVKVTHVFRINLCVTYPPQRTRQCLWRTISLLINTTTAGNKSFTSSRLPDTPCEVIFSFWQVAVWQDNVLNVGGHYREISPFRAKQDASASRRSPVRPDGNYFPIMTCVLYIIPYIINITFMCKIGTIVIDIICMYLHIRWMVMHLFRRHFVNYCITFLSQILNQSIFSFSFRSECDVSRMVR